MAKSNVRTIQRQELQPWNRSNKKEKAAIIDIDDAQP
jgi:hypothetical protein